MHLLHRLIAGAVALSAVAGSEVAAQTAQQPVVVELYTSQGCSSCPPADAFMAGLAGRDDIIVLALHVDYWDYLGWKDPFAQPGFTERQKRYARAARTKMVYTPQIIVGGTGRVAGLHPDQIHGLIAEHAALPPVVRLQLTREGDRLRIAAVADAPAPGEMVLQLVRYRPSETTEIEAGENAGHTGVYHNIVTLWQPLADWTGQAPIEIEVPAEGQDPLVVIVQERGPGRIVAAARLR
jgi:hypothetical protein